MSEATQGARRSDPPGREIDMPDAAEEHRIAELLTVCPSCDLVHRRRRPRPGETVACTRCGTVLETRKPDAPDRIIGASVVNVLLIGVALWAPFLTMSRGGITQRISLVDTADALATGWVWPLGTLLIALTVAAPLARAGAFLYALVPVRLAGRPPPGAAVTLRLAARLKPWAMAEIFTIGVAVSLVKLAGLATVTPGPAFWALGGMILVIGFENGSHCRESLWSAIEARA